MTHLSEPLRLRVPRNGRPSTVWYWILFLWGFCLGWIIHTHLG